MTVNLHTMGRTLALLFLFICNAVNATADLKLATSEITNPPKDLKYTFGDSEGYIWYGTQRGLYRDDNFSLKYFPLTGGESPVNMIAEETDGDLLLATDNGAWRLSKQDYTFHPIDTARLANKNISFIGVTSEGSLWVGQKGKLSRYDKSGEWQKDYPLIDRSGKATTVSGFCESREGQILLSSYSSGILRYEKGKDRFVNYRSIPNGESLGKILQDKDFDYFWVHDFEGMIYRFDPEAKNPEDVFVGSYVTKYGDKAGNRQWVRDMVQDVKYGYLWCSSRHGLQVMKPENDGKLTAVNVPVLRELDGAFINGLLPWQGAIRVTCYNNPSLLVHLDDSNIDIMPLPEIMNRYHNIAAITEIVEDDHKDLLWMLQMRSGLILYDLRSNRMSDSEKYHSIRLYRADHIAKSLISGGVWVSGPNFGTLYCVNHDAELGMEVCDSVEMWRSMGENEGVTKLLEDDAARLWVGTNQGLLSFDLRKPHKPAKRFNVGEVSDIITNSEGLVWVAGKKGLTKINPKDNKVNVYRSPDAVTALAHSTDGYIWTGSKTGKIMSFNPAKDEWKECADRLGRGEERIDKIFSDKYGHLWIVSESNVTQFNPRNNAHRHYRSGGRGALDLYLTATIVGGTQEEIIVGGMGGLTTFLSSTSLDVQSSNVEADVSDVKVNGESVYYKDGDHGFTRKGLTLPSSAVNVEFSFTAHGNINPSEVRFAYKLQGVDEEWNYTSPGSNRAFYNRLPKGRHRLMVKACDANNTWSDTVSTIIVTRQSAWYASWWAIIIYIMIGLAILYFCLDRYSRHVKDKNEEMWSDSNEMIKMREYLESPVQLPNEEFRELDKALLKKATEVVEKNISMTDFSVADLASGVNMSKSTLARKLKAVTGKTPSDFVKDIKIRYACRLLESQNHSVAEVAEMVGFDERRYFTSIFKKEVGVTPSAYQKGERNSEESNSDKSSDPSNPDEPIPPKYEP